MSDYIQQPEIQKIDEHLMEEEIEIKEELAIQTIGLKKYFGRGYNLVKAVDGIEIAVKEGEIHGYLGPNGAGKTTSMLMLAGTIRPTAGKGYIFGKPIGTPAAAPLVKVMISGEISLLYFDWYQSEANILPVRPKPVCASSYVR